MLKNGEFYSIKDMRGKGMSITQIADSLGRDRKTIRKWLDKNEPLKYQRSVTKTSILDPYKPYIVKIGCKIPNISGLKFPRKSRHTLREESKYGEKWGVFCDQRNASERYEYYPNC
ncbi:hypothetical protein NSQ24_02135 [Brevibacillus sp. FSL L8-0520]|uniref:hypothetical protein n=1 Tax=Brevibacillus TaxID=55080 RepID=UPI0030D0A859